MEHEFVSTALMLIPRAGPHDFQRGALSVVTVVTYMVPAWKGDAQLCAIPKGPRLGSVGSE